MTQNITKNMEEKKSTTETETTDVTEKSCDHHQCCGGSHKCRFGCAFLVIALILACVIGEYAYVHWNVKENLPTSPPNNPQKTVDAIGANVAPNGKNYDDQIEEIKKSLDDLRNIINTLKTMAQNTKIQLQIAETELKKLADAPPAHNLEDLAQENRKKWKIWINLKNKMEQDENFAPELELFYSAFAEDKELISLVKDIAKKTNAAPLPEEKGIIGTCAKYLRKIVKIKKISHEKLQEISGYVLSSVKK
ncbi:MAG: hypothetical protein LBB12_04455 [Holosporaceae bacterium]|jgi:hypothetical protein|nr:hypothetical protein [Holosporaceae bacterium]